MGNQNGCNKNVKIIYHPDYLTSYPTASCESPDRVSSILNDISKVYEIVKPEPCTEEDILLCHSSGLLSMEKTDRNRYEVARLAAGGAIMAAGLAIEGYRTFGLIRPPGHHANPDHNWGFCFFNNIAIAIRKLINDGKISSAVILDIDLHYGDGTEAVFQYDDNVTVINISASNPEDFIKETSHSLDLAPSSDIIGISTGFDQYILDWGGNLSTEDYQKIGTMAGEYAMDRAGGRIFAVLEGGYYIPDLGKNTLALIKGMCGI